jgi:Glycosyl transferase family 2
MPARPTLTLSITARDCEQRLALMLAEAELYADEIVVGVDAASTDGTWDVAVSGADRVFAFAHTGVTAPARMAALERASCDWILFLDDDEGMDAAFGQIRDELCGDPVITHWWLPRKWAVAGDGPDEFLRAPPWWPDYALRLTRADPTRVWKPLELHTGLRAIGPGGWETRAAIIHYEFTDRTAAQRAAKMELYRARGQQASNEAFYAPRPDVPRAPIDPPPLRDPRRTYRRRAATVDPGVDDLDARPPSPGWAAEVSVDMPSVGRAGEPVTVEAWARNTGTLRWDSAAQGRWPNLGLGYRLSTGGGTPLPDPGHRGRVGHDVPPGGEERFIIPMQMPDSPGEYVLRWQMVSELEHWFDDLGSEPAVYGLTVIP